MRIVSLEEKSILSEGNIRRDTVANWLKKLELNKGKLVEGEG